MFAGDTQFDEHLIGYGYGGQVDFLQIGSEVADLIDEFVGDIVFVLQIQKM